MKRFGLHKAFDEVVAAHEVGSIHIKIKKFSELAEIPTQRVAMFIGNDGEYRTGDVIIKDGEGNWLKVNPGSEPIAPVTRLRCRRVGSRVVIRWKDPDDTYDSNMNKLTGWSRTVLVRKYGSEPVSILDGTHVYTNFKRNRFNTSSNEFYADSVPIGDTTIPLYYKAFAISEHGYIANDSVAVEVSAMPWSEISETIKNGYGSGIFDAGDVLVLTNADESKSLELICLGNDCTESAKRVTSPHTIAFGFRYLYDKSAYDAPSSYTDPETADGYSYKRTKDKYSTAGKTYYLPRYVSGAIASFRRVGISIGSSLSGAIYYERIPETRAANGNYRWNLSDLRAKLNSEEAGSPIDIIRSIDLEFADIITDTVVPTRKHVLDGSGTEESVDKFFIPSITEVFGTPNGGEKNFEGTHFPYFETETPEMFVKMSDSSLVTSGWHTRSGVLDDEYGSGIYSVNEHGVQIQSKASTQLPCFVVFSIG
jgi:hypothetical protein